MCIRDSVMTVTQKDNQGGESSKEVRFSKDTDDDKVVVNSDLTDSGGAGLPASQYLALGSGFVVKYSVGVGTAGGGTVGQYYVSICRGMKNRRSIFEKLNCMTI